MIFYYSEWENRTCFPMFLSTGVTMKLPNNWHEELQEEISLPYMQKLRIFLEKEKQSGYEIYPKEEEIFSAFLYTSYNDIKVVIVGQDPYHGPDQAHGLSFSVKEGIPLPRSLKNIFQEIHTDLQVTKPQSGCLIPWAKQGVFLLNSILTVRAKQPMSHHNKGWEKFTDVVIQKLCERKDPIIFILWGKAAQKKCEKIQQHPHHKILTSSHPSPYSVKGFWGCRHFSKTNEYLIQFGKKPINWC